MIEVTCSHCGSIFYKYKSQMAGFKNNYCSRECCRSDRSKEANPNWRGSTTSTADLIRKSKSYKDWRMLVFNRDSFTCQHCGEDSHQQGTLQAHHIMSFQRFPELQLSVDNGITLCRSCHKEFHNTYGIKSFTSDDFYEWNK